MNFLDWISEKINGPKVISPVPDPSPTPTPYEKTTTLPDGSIRTMFVSPTPTASPTPTKKPIIPEVLGASNDRVEPYPVGPGTPPRSELYPRLQTENQNITPELYDATMKNISDDYKRRLALALFSQESSGGKSLYGDFDENNNPRAFGPAHIQPGNAPPVPGYFQPTKEQAMDPNWVTKYLNDYMNYNELQTPKEGLMRRWNYNSGYQGDLKLVDKKGNKLVNSGPRYDVDIPRAATMSAFIKK
jgi:hypothetical protein